MIDLILQVNTESSSSSGLHGKVANSDLILIVVLVILALGFASGTITLGHKSLTAPEDHLVVLSRFEAFTISEEVNLTLSPTLKAVHLDPSGIDRTTWFLGNDGFPEAILIINTWNTVEEGGFGRHSLEVMRAGWGVLHIRYEGVNLVEFSFPAVNNTDGVKPGYWSTPDF